MGKACQFCDFSNSFICRPEDHCGMCAKGYIADDEPDREKGFPRMGEGDYGS